VRDARGAIDCYVPRMDDVTLSPSRPSPRPPRVIDSTTLLTHAALVGLTPLIPIPLLDDAVKGAIDRRLVRAIGLAHGHSFSKEDVLALTDDGQSLLVSVAKGIVTFPLKLIFRKLFVVLEVKRASDEASRCYHRGLLLDLALGAGALAPKGSKTPAEVRVALDRTCDEVKVSPLGSAIEAAFEGSRSGLATLGRGLVKRLARGGKATDEVVEEAVEAQVAEAQVAAGSTPDAAAGPDRGALPGLVARLKLAIDAVPAAHFVALEDRFEAILGVPLTRERSGTPGG
jgi:hypothetical protein